MSSLARPALSQGMNRTAAAIYARISTTAADRDKVADQVAQCRRLAERRGYDVVEIFTDDGISGLGGKARPGWNALLSAIDGKRVSVVLATEEERFARNIGDKADLQAACIDAGAVWETIRDGYVDPASESGEFFSTMRAAMGRMESRRKAARQRARNEEASAEGRPVPGRRRYGYESDGITRRPAEAAVVRRMFEHVAAGGSIRGITRALVAEGVDPAPGREWSNRRVRDTLMNPHYAGIIRHRGVLTPSPVVVPIVDADLAAEVRALLEDPSRRISPGSQPEHLASGIACCGVCGGPIYHLARAYRCKASSAHPSIKKETLDARLAEEVARAFLVGGAEISPSPEGGVDVPALVAERARNVAEVEEIMSDRAEGLVPPDLARNRLRALRGKRERIDADLDRARVERGASGALAQLADSLLVGDEVTMGAWQGAAEAVAVRFATLDLDARRELVRALLYVEVHPGRDPRRVHVEHLRALSLNPWTVDVSGAA